MPRTSNKNRDPMLPLSAVRARITRTWLWGAGFTALILVVSSILRGRAEAARDVWSWFLPLVLPTIGLMVGVLGAAAMTRRKEVFVRKSFVDIALGLSVAYLAMVSATVLLEPLSPLRGAELYGTSNYWLGPLQGLVVAALGYLFTSGESKGSAAEADAASGS
ncbi:MAG TPA: hypothetical protein VHK24_07775 [Steroidobacter sp.]|jgi:hypothetical protein|nr:hypothetical protein [Steroidobacter sp.]